ncbi:unnamed protein product [Arctogadus glacialis]
MRLIRSPRYITEELKDLDYGCRAAQQPVNVFITEASTKFFGPDEQGADGGGRRGHRDSERGGELGRFSWSEWRGTLCFLKTGAFRAPAKNARISRQRTSADTQQEQKQNEKNARFRLMTLTKQPYRLPSARPALYLNISLHRFHSLLMQSAAQTDLMEVETPTQSNP